MQIFGLRYVGNREEEWIDAAGLILTDPLHALVGCQSRLSECGVQVDAHGEQIGA